MKQLLALFFVLSVFFIGNSISAQKTDLTCFNKIDVSNEIDVELVLDKNCGIEWTLTNIEPDKIVTEIKDKTLKLSTKLGIYKDARIKAKVYYTELTGLITSGRGVIWSEEDLYVDKINFNLGSGGEARLIVHADTVIASMAEGSVMTISGDADVIDVKVGTGATFSGYNLNSRVATVLSNSAGKAKIAVSENLYAKATSKGFIGYIGEPEFLVKEATLGGEISQTVKEQ